jgi:hypothetical protein
MLPRRQPCVTSAPENPLRQPDQLNRIRHVCLLALALGLHACTLYGPGVTRSSHLAYNEAVQSSEQHELLLNIVRLRYLDAPEFLAINSISTQLRVEAQASVLSQFGKADGNSVSTVAPGASVGYSESPIVTFTPQQNERFTRQLVAPASLESIYLLTRYGWGMERVLTLAAESINGLSNDVPREDISAPHVNSMRKFQRLCRSLQALDADSLIEMDVSDGWEPLSAPIPARDVDPADLVAAAGEGYRFVTSAGGGSVVLERPTQRYVLRLHANAAGTAHAEELQRLAGLRPGREFYAISPPGMPAGPQDLSLRIRTRSVLGVMAWLSRGVVAPPLHIEHGLVARRDELSELVEQWLVVQHAGAAPPSAWLAVPYRGYWFYIDSRDLNSRRTLGLLSSLIRLEISAGGAQNVPVLTVPLSH